MAATYNKFNVWAEAMVEGANLDSDVIKFALFAAANAPDAADTTLAGIGTAVSLTNLSGADPTITITTKAQTSGTYTFDADNRTILASGGAIGPFRYIVLYDDTLTGDVPICWYDYGSEITLNDGESLAINFNASGIFTLS